jgi:hypothetical protein
MWKVSPDIKAASADYVGNGQALVQGLMEPGMEQIPGWPGLGDRTHAFFCEKGVCRSMLG